VLARPIGNARDTDLVHRAESHGLAPAALSPLSISSDCGQGLLLSFTNIPEERASELAGVLRRAIENNASRSEVQARATMRPRGPIQ
jgi:hypothetical protein